MKTKAQHFRCHVAELDSGLLPPENSLLFSVPTTCSGPASPCLAPHFEPLTDPCEEGRGEREGEGTDSVLLSQFTPWTRAGLCCLWLALKWLCFICISPSPLCLRPQDRAKPGSVQQEIPSHFRSPFPKTTWASHPAAGLPLPSFQILTPKHQPGNWGGGPGPSAGACSYSSPKSPCDLGPVTSPLWASVCSLLNERMSRPFKPCFSEAGKHTESQKTG